MTAAIIGSVLGSVASGVIGSRASGNAADTQAQAASDSSAAQERMLQKNLDFQQKQLDQQRADNSSTRDLGNAARNKLARRMGLSMPAPVAPPPSLPAPSTPAPAGGGGGGSNTSLVYPQGSTPQGNPGTPVYLNGTPNQTIIGADGQVWMDQGGTWFKISPQPGDTGGQPLPKTNALAAASGVKTQTSAPAGGSAAWNREFERLNNIPPQPKVNQDAQMQYYQSISAGKPQYKMPGSQPMQPSAPMQPTGPQTREGEFTFANQEQQRYGTTSASAGAASSSYNPNWLAQRQGNHAANPTTSTAGNTANTNAPAATSPGGTPTQNPGVYVDSNGNYAWSDSPHGAIPADPAGPAVSSAPPGGTLGEINRRQDIRGLPNTGAGNALATASQGSVTSPRFVSGDNAMYDYNADSDGGLDEAYGERAPDMVTQPYSSQPGALTAPNQVLKPFGMEDFVADPGYKFRLQQGNQGIERSAAAQGGQLSGATMKALARFNQGTADQAYGDAYNRYNQNQGTVYNQSNQNYTNAYNRYNTEQNNIRDQANQNYTGRYDRFNQNKATQFNQLSAMAGGGQLATDQNNAASQNMANNANAAFTNTGNQVGQNIIGAGNADAARQIGSANAWSSGINSGINAFNQNQLLNQFSNNNNAATGAFANSRW